VDESKDQTYFLFGLTQAQLARTLFPLGELNKPEVRDIARSMDLAVASKGDSQEICFVPNGDYAAFMDAYLKEKGVTVERTSGEIVTTEGRTLGRHEGVHHFTVGQRKGLGIATGEPLYVIATDPASQRVTVGGNDDLQCSRFVAKEVNWISIAGWLPERPCGPRSRSATSTPPPPPRSAPRTDADRVEVRFDDPQRAITPGQGAVFYRWRDRARRRLDRIALYSISTFLGLQYTRFWAYQEALHV
jgi:tRNA-specific 2-thiouridylase